MAIAAAAIPPTSRGLCVPQRYVLAFMGFLAIANGYIQRFCLSLAITEMVVPHDREDHDADDMVDLSSCPYQSVNSSITDAIIHTSTQFDWSERTQGVILSAVFWGYVLTQLPGGLLAERLGGKHVLGVGLLVSTLGTLLTPEVANLGPYWLVAVRFCIGLGQGVMYPSLNVMLAQWAPPQERGRLGAAIFAGAQIGNVVSMAVGGLLMRYTEGGWVNVFYVFGAIGLVWLALWEILCYSEPESHPFISDEEKQFLMTQSVGQLKRRKDLPPTPWRYIFTSVPLWGLIIAQIGHDWGLFTIITDLPKYMKSVMHFSIAQNGILSAAPYLAMWIFAVICGGLVDFLVSRKIPITTVRKIFISIAASGPAFGILAATYSGCDKVLVSMFFTIGMGLMGAFVPSLKVNALDLSPNYAGTLMALVGGIGAISGIITPYLVGLLTPNSTLLEWRLVFWIAVIVLVSTNVVYLLVGSAEVQEWNDPLALEDGRKPSIIPRKPSHQEKFSPNGLESGAVAT
ncbi:putative inorganic phosphate cotransporter isoform X1 [Homalodisca vitripennis]|uniref:putative inorganic phosphate cotransporter isoform X1 n=2 Tax=Homalodisca vitripennis TaxID=197043 RepID=UPI001EEA84C7|nr:putative inorganic phosphate cotransporter isoform X1 [Homalodisca vitripennis]